MEPRQEESTQETKRTASEDQRTLCSKRIKQNLRRSHIYSQKRSPILFRAGDSFSRSAYPAQRETEIHMQAAKKKMHCINMNLKHFHSLQKLKLVLQKEEAAEMDLYYIAQTLKKPTSLHSLTMNFVDCYELSNKAFYYLNRGLKRLSSSLKSLNLGFQFRLYNEQITDEKLNYLNRRLRKLTRLEEINLNFAVCFKITDSGAARLIANLENLRLLKSLTFSFAGGDDFTERGFLDLCDSLKRLPSLQTLSLRLRSNKRVITDSVLKRLGEALERHASLRSLNFNVEIHEETSDLGLQELCKGLSKLVSLKRLRFKILGGWSSKELGDKGLLDLSEALKRLVHLRTLNIDFHCGQTSFTDQGLSHLSKALEQLKCLEEISLRCGEALKITDKGLKILGQGLGGLVLLQKIQLNLWSLEKITDLAGYKFCEALTSLPSLKEFDLIIERSFNFSGAGLYLVCQALKDIPSLEIIRYDLREAMGYVKKEKLLEVLENPMPFFPNLPKNFDPKGKTCSIF